MRGMRMEVFCAVALLFLGCEGAGTFESSDGSPPGDGAGGYVSEGGGSQLTPTVWGRVARRLSVAQLRATFPVVLGNDVAGAPITWMLSATTPGLDLYARALGEPDFLDTTQESLEPTPLYAKFIEDAARDVCNRAILADRARPNGPGRVLLRHVSPADASSSSRAAVDENLRYLRLRFHGIAVGPEDDAPIALLRALFDEATAETAKPEDGWRAVCVALVTAPEFSIY